MKRNYLERLIDRIGLQGLMMLALFIVVLSGTIIAFLITGVRL